MKSLARQPFVQLLLAALGPAALVGVAAGTIAGWHYLDAGFPLLLLDAVRRAVAWALAGAAVYVALYALGRRLAARLSTPWSVALSAAVAAAPFVTLAGYRLNRARAVRPSEILEPYALVPNLLLLAGCFAAYTAVAAALLALARKPRTPPAWVPAAAAAALVTLQAGVSWAFRQDAGGERPDVIVLLVDALRADHLGCYGYGRDTSPAIDALARDGVVFRQAISQSTFTKTSIASLFTGRYPYRHGVYWGSRRTTDDTRTADLLGESETTIAEVLRDHGYLTAAWVQNSHLRPVMGFGQGFTDYRDQQGSIRRIHRRVLPWLHGPGRRYGFFAYLHYIDLHDPYRPEPPYDTLFGTHADVYRGVDFRRWGAFLAAVRDGEKTLTEAEVEQLRALYDGQLRAIDDEIGRLLDRLRDAGLYDDALIVLTSDHGDAFMEHGFISHSAAPYEELVRVPLVVKLPGQRHAGTVVESQVRLVDVMPTILAATGIAADVDLDGCDLMPWIAAGGRPGSAAAECTYAVIEIAEDDGPPALAVRTERFKYIHRPQGRDELYDLAADPGERQDLAAALDEETAPLRDLAQGLAARRAGADSMALDEKLLRELRALGYVDD
jgi:arylsulfatase A-like enzyme